MPITAETSDLETMSLILTKAQARRLRMIAEIRSTPHRSVKISEVAREVVATGLAFISQPAPTAANTTQEPAV